MDKCFMNSEVPLGHQKHPTSSAPLSTSDHQPY